MGKKQEDIFTDALLYNLTAPIITASGRDDMMTVETHRSAITLHRMADNIRLDLMKNQECTDYEAMLYLSTLSLVGPLTHESYKVYMYLGGKYMQGMKDMMKDVATRLEPDEEQVLRKLKRQIFADQMKQIKARK